MKKALFVITAVLITFSFACSKKNIKKDSAVANQETVQKVEDVSAASADNLKENTEADIRNPEFSSHEGIQTVYFDFDKYEISPKAAQTLSKNARVLKEKKWTVLIEGHCDNRGTVEYNLALGQKRANVIKEYYIKLGVPENTIGTISYGEESPVCKEDTEDCWAKNRRAETKVNIQ